MTISGIFAIVFLTLAWVVLVLDVTARGKTQATRLLMLFVLVALSFMQCSG